MEPLSSLSLSCFHFSEEEALTLSKELAQTNAEVEIRIRHAPSGVGGGASAGWPDIAIFVSGAAYIAKRLIDLVVDIVRARLSKGADPHRVVVIYGPKGEELTVIRVSSHEQK
jgi:hypothetical protein